MPDIKTRDAVKGTVKVIDKSAVAAERMKDAYVRTKDKAEHSVFAAESSPEEYAADRTLTGTETAVHEVAHGLDKVGRKGIKTTKENISKAKDYFQRRKADLPKKQTKDAMRRVRRSADTTQKAIKTVDRSGKTIKQTAKSTGKAAVKTTQKSIKTAEQTSRTTIKTTQAAAKTAQKTAQATAKAAKTAAQTARAAAKATAAGIKAAVKAAAAAVKARRPPGSIWNVWQGGPSGTRWMRCPTICFWTCRARTRGMRRARRASLWIFTAANSCTGCCRWRTGICGCGTWCSCWRSGY